MNSPPDRDLPSNNTRKRLLVNINKMPDQKKWWMEKVNISVQTVGILLAGAWAIYIFVYREYWIPQSAPINLSLNLELKKMAVMEKKKQKNLSVIELTVIAKNPSTREVFLMPSCFIVYGYKVIHSKTTDDDFVKMCEKASKDPYSIPCTMKHVKNKFVSTITAGGIFQDSVLKPNEQIEMSLIFHVPNKEYDLIDTIVSVPTMRKKNGVMLRWHYDINKNRMNYALYQSNDKGGDDKIEGDKLKKVKEEYELQFANSARMLSLWAK